MDDGGAFQNTVNLSFKCDVGLSVKIVTFDIPRILTQPYIGYISYSYIAADSTAYA